MSGFSRWQPFEISGKFDTMLVAALLLATLPAGSAASMSLEQIEAAVKRCGTRVVVQKLPSDMEETARNANLTFYPQITLAKSATKRQRKCVNRHVPVFGLMDKWMAEHPRH